MSFELNRRNLNSGLMQTMLCLFLLWPANPAWILETSTNLSQDTWVPMPDPPLLLGDQYAVPVQVSEPQRFYRLRYSE